MKCTMAKQVLEAGADSIAVISAITKADDVAEAVRQWSAVFEASSSSAPPSSADGASAKEGPSPPRTESEILAEQQFFGVA